MKINEDFNQFPNVNREKLNKEKGLLFIEDNWNKNSLISFQM